MWSTYGWRTFAAQASLDMIADAVSFEVVSADLLGTGRLPPTTEGPVFCRAHWKLRKGCEVSDSPQVAAVSARALDA